DREKIRDFVGSFPDFIRPQRSLGFYGQMMLTCEGNGEVAPQLVLNAIRAGFGRGEARLRFLEAQAGVSVPPPSPRTIPDGEAPLWVDIPGVFGSNTSAHIAQTPYELTYPAVVSNRPPEERIPLNDLIVSHDPQSNRLRLISRRLQREVLPVHLGMLADLWQPPLYRFLLTVFGEKGTDVLLSMVQIPDIAGIGADMALRSYPRVYLGSLVLGRFSWMVGVQQLPKREKGMSSFDYMLQVQRWLATHQLPQECFVRIPIDLLPPVKGSKDTSTNALKDRKPLHIDFRNYLSVMMFEQIVSHAEQLEHPEYQVLLLQEVLPCQEDLQISDGRATYVSELLIELTRTGESR
ncbi:MAG TPA: lantibiotic dehydratase, partial [Ktedonobacteraceae bacterium]|nr:lantibiotic dehydratase [Ktedonobacteraceae bacterium]